MYSRIRYDIFFKKVFQQEHILKAFLNTVLHDELSAPITSLTYQSTEFIGKAERQALNLLKHTIIDVFVTTQDGTRALVEIQKGTEKSDLLRFVDYQCRNFSHQFHVGDDYTQSVPCYSICWLFDMTPPHHDYQEKLTITSNKKHTDWDANWEIIAVYPRCITQTHLEKKALVGLEEWLLLDVMTDVKRAQDIQTLIHTKEVRDAFEQLDISGLTDEEVEELQFQQVMEQHQKPFEKHLKKREYEKACEIAKNLLTLGVDLKAICEATNLNEQEIHMLQSSQE